MMVCICETLFDIFDISHFGDKNKKTFGGGDMTLFLFHLFLFLFLSLGMEDRRKEEGDMA